MSTPNGSPIYRFASLRSPKNSEAPEGTEQIMPSTAFTDDLIDINHDEDLTSADKLIAFNTALQAYVDGEFFIKTKTAFKALKDDNPEPDAEYIEQLYDNVILRTLTKSTSNPLYKMIVDELRSAYVALYVIEDEAPEIVISSNLVPSFTEYESRALGVVLPGAPGEAPGRLEGEAGPREMPADDGREISALFAKVEDLANVHRLIGQAKSENVVRFDSAELVTVFNPTQSNLLNTLGIAEGAIVDARDILSTRLSDISDQIHTTRAFNVKSEDVGVVSSTIESERAASATGILEIQKQLEDYSKQLDALQASGVDVLSKESAVTTSKYADVLRVLSIDSVDLIEAEAKVSAAMELASKSLNKLVSQKKYSRVGENWVETSDYAIAELAEVPAELATLDSNCELKFPFRIADLRVVEQEPVGYLPGEIAHINNTQPGEKNTRVTRRLKKVETDDTLITQEDIFHETDTQSTEKFSLENEASTVQTNSNALSAKLSASASFGPYSISADLGYSTSSSTVQSNSSSMSQAKEVVESIVDRVSRMVRTERRTKTLEEFEETVTHEINNEGQGTKSHVYRWLNKLVRARLKNYGKRLIFQFDVAHPAHYYLSRAIKDMPQITMPDDPRELSIDGKPVFNIDTITRDNYLAWGTIYKTELEQPPAKNITVSDTFSGTDSTITSKMIQIKKDYKCKNVKVTAGINNGWPYSNSLVMIVGNAAFGSWSGGNASWNGGPDLWSPFTLWLNNETEQLPVSLMTGSQGFGINLEIACELTDEAYQAWKIGVYNAIVDAYEQLKAQAESELSSFNPNLPGLPPAKKYQLIRDELKKETIRKMFRCNPFWINDKFVVGNEYDPNCCVDSMNAERVRFLEKTFDWENMTYELHPYFYSNKNSWSKLLDLSDDDTHFESFLQASFVTVQVPVHRDHLLETAAINFVKYNSIFNYEVVPQDEVAILDELDEIQQTEFTYDLEGNPLPVPSDVIDMGIFNLPTSLVILECGVSDGVKPIGFPQSEDEPTSDVIIPKQYSPAIIADSCTP